MKYDILFNDDIVLNNMVSGIELVKQKINILFKIHEREWFMDTSYGIPYLTILGNKDISYIEIVGIVTNKIRNIQNVDDVLLADIDLDEQNNKLIVSFSVKAFNTDFLVSNE